MADYHQILKLLLSPTRKWTTREIAQTCGCSHSTITRANHIITQHDLTWEMVENASATQLATWFPDGRKATPTDYLHPNFDDIIPRLVGKPRSTRQQLYAEYLNTPTDLAHYSQERFNQLIRTHMRENDYVLLQQHEPANAMQVDWTGSKLIARDLANGAPIKLAVFVATLPFSGMIYACAQPDEKRCSWEAGHVGAFEYFGGAPNTVIPDNARTATDRQRTESRNRFRVTENYRTFLAHYQTTPMPTRIYKPKDKGGVEAAVKIVTHQVIGTLNGIGYLSLDQINKAIIHIVDQINDKPNFRRIAQSRRELFEEYEQAYLAPLPERRWEPVTRLVRKVNRDLHIEVNKSKYSVPWKYVGHEVVVLTSASRITVLGPDSEILADHAVAPRPGMYISCKAHFPADGRVHKGMWSAASFIEEAGRIGPNTAEVVSQLLDVDLPFTRYRLVRGMLDKASRGKRSVEQYQWARQALEQACGLVLRKPKGRGVSVNQVTQHFRVIFNQGRPVDNPAAADAGISSDHVVEAYLADEAKYWAQLEKRSSIGGVSDGWGESDGGGVDGVVGDSDEEGGLV